jgi:type II secretory pathway pseudopilin PulG
LFSFDFFQITSKAMKNPIRRHHSAFSLIELMATITIIIILAGVIFGGMSYVNEKQANEKAKVQIALLSKALEEYKLDNGVYPPTTEKPSTVKIAGTSTSNILYRALYGDGAASPDTKKIYLSQLDPINNKQGWIGGTSPGYTIVDPWGNQYCYRTAFGPTPANGPAPAWKSTQNPDFDLWSMGKDGETSSSSKDDIRNF